MGRADTAGGEHIVVFRAAGIQRVDDLGLDVSHDPRLAHLDAQKVQFAAQIGKIGVVGPARENLVADHQDRCCHAFRITHARATT